MEPKQPWVPKKFYPYSLQAYLHSKVDESMWYKDNKYSRHMIEEKKVFISLELKRLGKVTLGYNTKCKVLGLRTIDMKMPLLIKKCFLLMV